MRVILSQAFVCPTSGESQSEMKTKPNVIHRAHCDQDIITSWSSNYLLRHLASALKGLDVLTHFTDGQTEAKHCGTIYGGSAVQQNQE